MKKLDNQNCNRKCECRKEAFLAEMPEAETKVTANPEIDMKYEHSAADINCCKTATSCKCLNSNIERDGSKVVISISSDDIQALKKDCKTKVEEQL